VMGLAGPAFVAGAGALAFLLLAEVVASTAVTSEAALVYLAPRDNLWWSVVMISAQGALSVGLCLIVTLLRLPPLWYGVAVAAALSLALGLASFAKARLLARLTGHPVHGWRPALLYAAAAAVVLGWLATRLPEWAELLFGVPLILALYGYLIWTRGFGPADRALLRGGKDKGGAVAT
jgi:hypothetical protein